MFRWYRNAAQCYVYLSDVSAGDCNQNGQFPPFSWESAFRASTWFTRCWTLQELLAPDSVEFFSRVGKRLGDKKSLERQVHETTGIAVRAHQGDPLSQFSIDERFSWPEKRRSTRKEDASYSLLGIFDLHMSLIYGEGRGKALIRLKKKIERLRMVRRPHLNCRNIIKRHGNTNICFHYVCSRFFQILRLQCRFGVITTRCTAIYNYT
jgi:hypothetical protein